MKRVFKNKKTLVVFICACLTIVMVGVNVARTLLNTSGGNSVNSADKTGGIKANDYYLIPYNPTSLQKDLYQELTASLDGYSYTNEDPANHSKNEQEIEICNNVVKNFVADFYTWSNKNSSYDVGGMGFVWGNGGNIYEAARDTYYEDLDAYVAKYGRENLPKVASVDSYTVYGGVTYFFVGDTNYFYSEATWTYEDCDFDISSFPTKAGFMCVYDFVNECFRITKILNID